LLLASYTETHNYSLSLSLSLSPRVICMKYSISRCIYASDPLTFICTQAYILSPVLLVAG
ncbi:unnamed protein product, partial [Prunus brigantina]